MGRENQANRARYTPVAEPLRPPLPALSERVLDFIAAADCRRQEERRAVLSGSPTGGLWERIVTVAENRDFVAAARAAEKPHLPAPPTPKLSLWARAWGWMRRMFRR